MKKNLKNKNSIAGYYGQELILDLYDCQPKTIRSQKKLKEFIDQLCLLLKMKKFGRPLIPRFGHNQPKTAGYSLVQLIETSSITGHFSELWNSAYINIFSCQSFDVQKVAQFTKQFFQAKKVKKRVIIRK
jgi:S-adenosylmethionine/arginine decarboxylase-like enzyme